MGISNEDQKKLMRDRCEAMGAQQVRTMLQSGGISQHYNLTALEWLAEKDKEAERLAASSQAETALAASRAATAAGRAATAAEAQARTAKHALITAIVATAIAATALIVSVIGFLRLR